MENDVTNRNGEGSIKPVPDPTTLTTEQLLREVFHVRELVESRLNGMDKAMQLFSDSMTRVPTDTDKQVQHLRELHDEKFLSIQTQFKERDTRAEQSSKDSKVAVDAALQAAKEAVGEQNKSSALAIQKSENSTVKQIDQLVTLISTTSKSLDDKINDLKERVTRFEGVGAGSEKTKETNQIHSSWGIALASLLTGTLIGIIGIILVLLRK